MLVRLGGQLRRLRVLHALEGQELARELGWSPAKLSRIEQGKIRVSVSDLAAALAALGAPEELRAEMLAGLAADGELAAWMVRSGGVARRQSEVSDLEQRALSVWEYNPLLVPGQLQTQGYTRAMAAAAGFDAEALVPARARRQALMAVDGAPAYRTVLDQGAFARWPGDAGVMVAQLGYIAERMRLANIDVRLLPAGPNAGRLALGAFVVYEFAEVGPVVLLEHHGLDVFLASAVDVARYREMFEQLCSQALSESETAAWLVSLKRKLSRGKPHD